MNDAKHTKGPWKQGDGKRWDSHAIFTDDGTGFNGSGRFIARCEGATSGFDNEANARLIAAAPDLLEALQRCATLMKNGFIPPENIGKDAEEIVSGDYANGWDAACEEFRNSRTAEIAQAAIAKAEGR